MIFILFTLKYVKSYELFDVFLLASIVMVITGVIVFIQELTLLRKYMRQVHEPDESNRDTIKKRFIGIGHGLSMILFGVGYVIPLIFYGVYFLLLLLLYCITLLWSWCTEFSEKWRYFFKVDLKKAIKIVFPAKKRKK